MLTPEISQTVTVAVTASPTQSDRLWSLALGLSRSSFRRILDEELNFHYNKIMIDQQMSEGEVFMVASIFVKEFTGRDS